MIDLACLYECWAVRILARAFEADTRADKRPRILAEHAVSCWLHAEAIGARLIRDIIAQELQLLHRGERVLSGQDQWSINALVAHFITGASEGELRQAGWADLGPYASVASGSFTAAGYDELASIHAERAPRNVAPFDFYPGRLIPFELLVIERRTSIRMEGTHPLITSPLAARREVPDVPMTDELRAVIERARTELPGL